MLNKHSFGGFFAALLFSFGSHSALSETENVEDLAQRGMEISETAKARDTGWLDNTSDMFMILRNKQGQESIREIQNKTLELVGDGDKTLTIFNKPRDIKGTAFLSFSHTVGNDDQWLYLPSLKRVKRISSRNKSGPFMGSEFSFEDLSSFEVPKYTYKYLGKESLDGFESYKVEQYPVDVNSGYTRRIVWIDDLEYRILKVEFYDRKNSLLKTLTYKNFKQYVNKFWRPDTALMTNHQNGKSTELRWSNYAFQTGLKDADFNRNTLKRAR
jgi:outer membrane lipoprotein-sorting protein